MDRDKRPLSPHIQIYRPQWSSVLSIMHRITGLLLALGSLILTWWLAAVAGGPEAFAVVQAFLDSLVGRILLFGWTWALFYHLCNGVRHLVWDAGIGFELDTAAATGTVALAASVILTLAAWSIAAAVGAVSG